MVSRVPKKNFVGSENELRFVVSQVRKVRGTWGTRGVGQAHTPSLRFGWMQGLRLRPFFAGLGAYFDGFAQG